MLVRPVCVNASRWDCTLEPGTGRYHAVRLGLRQVRGLSNADGAAVVAARGITQFGSVEEVWRRSGVPRAAIEKLADADAFHEETVRRVKNLHLSDCLRANKSTSAWGLEARVPFLDKEVS